MIIHLNYKPNSIIDQKTHILHFTLPLVEFKDKYVHINEVIINWKDTIGDVFGYISSTLIDKSVENPKQQLLSFIQNQRSRILFHSPTHQQKYKVQRPNLQTVDFYLHLSKRVELREIHLQLEITDARIQQIHQKPF